MRSGVRALGRRQIAVIAAALVAFGGFAAYRTQSSAQAHETQVTLGMTCPLAGALSVNYTVDHEPESGAIAGQLFTLHVKSSVALPANFAAVAVNTMVINIPVPAGVTSGGDVMVMGGTFTKAGQSIANGTLTLNLTANAGTTVGTMAVPELMIPVNIPADAAGKTIAFNGPSSLAITVVVGNPITETCTANADNPPLVSAKVSDGSTPTTADPDHDHGNVTTTVPATTPTTAPATTTPTTAPTTKPATTVPATTVPTTKPATTTTMGGSTGGSSGTPTAEAPTAVSATPTYTG